MPPRLDAPSRRTLTVRCSDAELASIQAVASGRGVSVSEHLRDLIAAGRGGVVRRQVVRVVVPPAADRSAVAELRRLERVLQRMTDRSRPADEAVEALDAVRQAAAALVERIDRCRATP